MLTSLLWVFLSLDALAGASAPEKEKKAVAVKKAPRPPIEYFIKDEKKFRKKMKRVMGTGFDVLDANKNGFLYTGGRSVWFYSLKKRRRVFLTRLYGAAETARLSPNGQWVAFVTEDPEKKEFELEVLTTTGPKSVRKVEKLKKINFITWRDPCRLLVGTAEKKPSRFYPIKPDQDCKYHGRPLTFIFSNPGKGTWKIEKTYRKPEKLDWKKNIYDVKNSNGALTGAYTEGGIFFFHPKEDIHLSTSKGFRPSLNTEGNLVAYQTPEDEIYLWDPRRKKEEKIMTGRAPHFIGKTEMLVSTPKGIYRVDIGDLN